MLKAKHVYIHILSIHIDIIEMHYIGEYLRLLLNPHILNSDISNHVMLLKVAKIIVVGSKSMHTFTTSHI